MIESLRAELLAISPLEYVAVLLGVGYVLLIWKRSRYGWIAGAISSAIYVWIAARAQLPMQSALQAYYVLMAGYGWYSWTRAQRENEAPIGRWPLRFHIIALVLIVLASVATAHLLARETQAAWPYLDSLTTWTSLFATWLVARMKLENWLYWIAADAVTAYLFIMQAHAFSALLFITYMIIAIFGYREWRQKAQQISV